MKKESKEKIEKKDVCPKCGSPLSEVITTKIGRQLQRCSKNIWNEKTRKTEGCDYVKWLPFSPQILDERCPKCNAPLILTMTRFNKKMKKCSTSTWDPKTKQKGGCDYIEWLKGTKEQLEEICPKCGAKLILYTTVAGKKMKKCETNEWDRINKRSIGCDYIEWLK